MNAESIAQSTAREVARRCHLPPIFVPGPLRKVVTSFRSHLQLAWEARLITNPPAEIHRALKGQELGQFSIIGYGEHFDKGQEEGDFICRSDGARLSFKIQFEAVPGRANELVPFTY